MLFTLTKEETPIKCIIDSEELFSDHTTPPAEPVPITAFWPQPEPAIALPPMPNHPTVYTLICESPRQLPVLIPEAPFAEQEASLTPGLKTPLAASPRKHLHAYFKCLLLIPQPQNS